MLTSSKPCSFYLNTILTLFSFALLVSSCKTDDFKDLSDATIQQSGSYAFPVGQLNFTLADVLEDDTTLTIDDDNGIRLVYREDSLFTLAAADILDDITGDINQSFSQNSKIGSIAVDDAFQETDMIFSSFLDDFEDMALATFIQQSDGNMVPVPAFEEDILNIEDIPAFTEYTSLSIENGAMFLTITNNLFFDITDVSIEIIDEGNAQNIGTFYFDYLSVGEVKSSEISLQGKNISNKFKANFSTIKTPGTGGTPVLVDLSSSIHILFEVKNITISQGVVNLQAGILAEDELEFDFEADNGEQITYIVLDDAAIAYEIQSDVQTDILVKMTFPDVRRNNVPMVQEFTVSPTASSGPITGTLDFSNTLWYLDADPDQPYNRIRATYEVSLPFATTGQLAFSSEDEVSIVFTMSDLQVSEVIGFFGFRQEVFEESTYDLGLDLSFFSNESSPIYFSEPQMRIEITNSFGIPLLGEFNATANGYFGDQANLDPPKLIINYPSMSELGQSVETVFVMNKNNSNIVQMLSVFPSTIDYRGSATINPSNDPSIVNFVNKTSQLIASAEIDLPFKFSAEDLVYRDTGQAVDLGLDSGGFTIDDIDSAEMKIVYDNGLPMMSTINIIALDDIGGETVVVDNIQFASASVDANGRVPANGSTRGEAFIALTAQQIQQLDEARQYIYEIHLQTEDGGQAPVDMYTDYKVEMGIGMLLVLEKN